MTEVISENISKSQRTIGRPKKFPMTAGEKRIFSLGCEGKSDRTFMNRYYETIAEGILADFTGGRKGYDESKKPFEYILGTGTGRYQTGRKHVILTELGRTSEIYDGETIRVLAGEICQKKLKTADVVSFFRGIRQGVQP